jgi:hypothetical protein
MKKYPVKTPVLPPLESGGVLVKTYHVISEDVVQMDDLVIGNSIRPHLGYELFAALK